jgi:hypothetical protein
VEKPWKTMEKTCYGGKTMKNPPKLVDSGAKKRSKLAEHLWENHVRLDLLKQVTATSSASAPGVNTTKMPSFLIIFPIEMTTDWGWTSMPLLEALEPVFSHVQNAKN